MEPWPPSQYCTVIMMLNCGVLNKLLWIGPPHGDNIGFCLVIMSRLLRPPPLRFSRATRVPLATCIHSSECRNSTGVGRVWELDGEAGWRIDLPRLRTNVHPPGGRLLDNIVLLCGFNKKPSFLCPEEGNHANYCC